MTNNKWNTVVQLCNIGRVFANSSLNAATRIPKELIDDCREWLLSPSCNLILKGNVGSGKSFVLHALARALAEGGKHPIVYNSQSLDQKLLEGSLNANCGQSVQDKVRILSEAEFLFLDDLGTEIAGERMQRQYYSIFNGRYENDRPWVIATNCTFEEIAEKFGERIASRLAVSLTLQFPDVDLRKDIDIFKNDRKLRCNSL